jgi:hypothetical protein|tara:strand:+ start:3823 stop:4158 length:336 start_codon:yes stop_codon:yes gene_type:complete
MSANKEFDLQNTGAALGATTTGPTTFVGDATVLDIYLSCTAVSGTSPTFDSVVWSSADGTVWVPHTAFTQVTAASVEKKSLANFGNYIKVISTIGGSSTPTQTFTIKAVKK